MNGSFDLEAFEMSIRSSMHSVGSKLLEALLNADGGGHCGAVIPCEKSHAAAFVDYREKKVWVFRRSRPVFRDEGDRRSGVKPTDEPLLATDWL